MEESVVGVIPPANLVQPKCHVRFADESWHPLTQEEVANHQVDLVNQAMRQQIVPEGPAARDEDVLAGLAFELGDLLVGVCTPDDADSGRVSCQRV